MPRRLIKAWVWDDLPLPKKIIFFPQMKHPLHSFLKLLEVGQCVELPPLFDKIPANKLMAIKQRHAKSTGKSFKFRTIYPKPWSNEKKTHRIWRTK
jgi:hypothetical protein